MAGSVNKIKHILLAVLCRIVQGYGVCFNGNAAFPFNIHCVEHLADMITGVNDTAFFNNTVRKGGFPVVYMGNDGKISNVFKVHFFSLLY